MALSRAPQGQGRLLDVRHVRDLAVFAEFGAGLAHRLDHLCLHLQFGGKPLIGIDHFVGRNFERAALECEVALELIVGVVDTRKQRAEAARQNRLVALGRRIGETPLHKIVECFRVQTESLLQMPAKRRIHGLTQSSAKLVTVIVWLCSEQLLRSAPQISPLE